jgi:hypothetical protein
LFLLAAVGLVGCGGSELSPVSGTVLIDGQPFADAAVLFTPEAGDGLAATGETDESGRFVMKTRGTEPGVRPGKYKVIINAVDKNAPRATHPSEAFGKIAENNAGKKVDGNKEYRKIQAEAIKAARKKPHSKYSDPQSTPLTAEVPRDREVKFELTSEGK